MSEVINTIPENAFNLHVFAIKERAYQHREYEAFIGYNLACGDFHFVQIPVDPSVV